MEFSPEKGNVAFASAHDGWAFRVSQFADLYAAKLGFKASALTRALWGDYRIDAKTKRIMRIKPSQAGKYRPLFVQVRDNTSAGLCLSSNTKCHSQRNLWTFVYCHMQGVHSSIALM